MQRATQGAPPAAITADAPPSSDAFRDALREFGLTPDEALSAGEQARLEARRPDAAALARRFNRWFPAPDSAPRQPTAAQPPTAARLRDDARDLDELTYALEAVAELIELPARGDPGDPGDPRDPGDPGDRADAIELAERMCQDAGIGPWRYDALLTRHGRRLAPLFARGAQRRQRITTPPPWRAAEAVNRVTGDVDRPSHADSPHKFVPCLLADT